MVEVQRTGRSPPLSAMPSARISSPGRSAGSPWNSQPTRPGTESPFFIPVPAKIQWSGLVTIQSPPPLNGYGVRAPISLPSLGPSTGNGTGNLSFGVSHIGPYLPARVIIRFGRPLAPGRYGVTQQTAFPERYISWTPARTPASA